MSIERDISGELNKRKRLKNKQQRIEEVSEKQEQRDREKRLKLMKKYLKTSQAKKLLTEVNDKYLNGRGILTEVAEIQTYDVTDNSDEWANCTYSVTGPVVNVRLAWKANHGETEKECFIGVSVKCDSKRFDDEPYYVSINVINDLSVSVKEKDSIHEYQSNMRWRTLEIKRIVRKTISRRVADHIEERLITHLSGV